MWDKLKKVIEPQASLTVMCIAAAFYSLNRTGIAKVVMIVLALCAVALAVARYCKARKSVKVNPILYVLEVLGLAAFGSVYVLFYNMTIQDSEINVLFLLGSLILLIPMIVEIGLEAKKASEERG